jgi:uncharacterized protein (TIGR04255 family)
MERSKPINALNAIDSVTFFVQLSRAFHSDEIATARAYASQNLTQRLPKVEPINEVQFAFPANGASGTSTARETGVKLSKFNASGKAEWAADINRDQIAIHCSSYSRWVDVWDETESLFVALANVLPGHDNLVQSVGLRVVDRFARKFDGGEIAPDDVFNLNSGFLTGQAKNSGSQWHVHQGWFQEDAVLDNLGQTSVLNVLNLTRIAINGELSTTIEHVLQVRLAKSYSLPGLLGAVALQDAPSIGKNVFWAFHDANKTVLRSLLTPNQMNAIGMESSQ